MTSRYFTNRYRADGKVDVPATQIKRHIVQCFDQITHNVDPSIKNGAKGLYTGTAGIAYCLYHLIKSGLFPEENPKFLDAAMHYVKVALDSDTLRTRKQVGLLSGNGGVFLVAALIYSLKEDHRALPHPSNANVSSEASPLKKTSKYIEEYKKLAQLCEPIDFQRGGSDELFVGRAGYLFGVILLQRELKTEILSRHQIRSLCNVMIESGRIGRSEVTLEGNLPLLYSYHSKPYLGSAHGMAGILQVLLSFPQYLDENAKSSKMVQQSVDFLIERCLHNGNIATNLDGALMGDGKFLVHWCHGAAGIIYTFARAYFVFGKEAKYLNACKMLAETVWEKGLLKKGPGICHGVSGSGYVFLLMYRLTGEEKYLYRAERFAAFMFTGEFKEGANTPDRPYSLFEGWAGTLCFLADLLKPDCAEFPLFNIFVE